MGLAVRISFLGLLWAADHGELGSWGLFLVGEGLRLLGSDGRASGYF